MKGGVEDEVLWGGEGGGCVGGCGRLPGGGRRRCCRTCVSSVEAGWDEKLFFVGPGA